jgi:hypothetical protein
MSSVEGRSVCALTVLRAALVNLCFSAEGLSQVGNTGRGAAAAPAMHKLRWRFDGLHS